MRKHSFVSKAGMILPLLVLCVCAFGFVFAPNDPELVDLTKKFLAPCPEFPLGADNLGRCVLSRLLYGGRTTLGIVLVGSVTVSVFGTLIGLLMGSGKNGKNLILEGVLNAVTAIPPSPFFLYSGRTTTRPSITEGNVSPESSYRRQVATGNWARELGFQKSVLESRDVAVGFYEKLGYEICDGQIIHGDTFDCVRMEKML